MIPESVHQLLRSPSDETVTALLEDNAAVFNVDWREEDDAIVEYCESVLGTGTLAAQVFDIDEDPGFEMYISYAGQGTKVPLVVGHEDRHITLLTLNRVLAPEYEVRVLVDSNGSDTLTFLPLSSADWSALEAKYGASVAAHFRRIEEKPNLFTDPW
jgi:hypothetical protein